ncbi:MAG: hypothetical protein EXR71_11370 [Myxococcales bacterium]|nr:hypothetical protein [Myxococcales bacterium]
MTPLFLCLSLVSPAAAEDGAPAATPAEAPPRDPRADEAYLRALAAWRTGDSRQALREAQSATEIGGGRHEPAQLLTGYALLHTSSRAEGLAILKALAEGPAPAEDLAVRRSAWEVYHRYADRNERAHVSIFASPQVAARFSGDALVPGVGYSVGVDVPLAGLFGPALELSGYDTSSGDALIEGPVLDLLGSIHVPIGGGAWALRLKTGPSIWFAHGALYGDSLAPTLGTRTVLGFDARPWPAMGFFFDIGGWAWPGLAETLPSWMFAWDVRTGVVFWFTPKPARLLF